MNLVLSDLTDAAAVQAALDEFQRLGQVAFLAKYGFRAARDYLVRDPRTGRWADSKAIAGAALAHQFPGFGGLRSSDFSGGAATVKLKLELLGFEVVASASGLGVDWSSEEVAVIVADYLAMLLAELNGQRFNKSAHRRILLQQLPGRNDGAVEFKHANISAAMLELGLPYIKGYQPRHNFQRDALLREVIAQVAAHPEFDQAALAAANRLASPVEPADFRRVKVPAPRTDLEVSEPAPRSFRAFQRDYLEREAKNRSLGRAGEEFVVRFERWRLLELGLGQLAAQVRHVALTNGDGLGYDIRSFDTLGQPKFIEVKTTAFGERTPFFVSANELEFANSQPDRFCLSRVFDFREAPRLFELAGPLDRHVKLDPQSFRASFG